MNVVKTLELNHVKTQLIVISMTASIFIIAATTAIYNENKASSYINAEMDIHQNGTK